MEMWKIENIEKLKWLKRIANNLVCCVRSTGGR